MFSEQDDFPVPAPLLIEAQQWAAHVGFDFDAYALEWRKAEGAYPGTHAAAFLDWLGLHLFNQVEEGYPAPLPPHLWPAELWDFYWRLEARNVTVTERIDGKRTYHESQEHTDPAVR